MSEEKRKVGLKWDPEKQKYTYYILNPVADASKLGDTDKYEFLMIDVQIPESIVQKKKVKII